MPSLLYYFTKYTRLLKQNEIGQLLARSPNLISFAYSGDSYESQMQYTESGFEILSTIINAFLDHPGSSKSSNAHPKDANDNNKSDNGVDDMPFSWENKYKLKRVSICKKTWVVMKNGDRGIEELEKVEIGDSRRRVWVREVVGFSPWQVHEWDDFGFAWMEKVGGQ
jgi:hypothetical protein